MSFDGPGAAGRRVRFGDFELDAENAVLQRGTERLELPPKAFAVLCHLAARPGRLVAKDDLLDAVWGHRFVSESVLKTAINTIRTVLGDDAKSPRLVETVPRRGYRFIGSSAAPAMAAAASSGPVPLDEGETEVQRAPRSGRGWQVGRDAALAELLAGLAPVLAGGRRLLFVGGEAGIGKTTLVDHFCAAVRGSGVWLASGQCIEQVAGGEPFLPVLDALAALARSPEGPAWVSAMSRNAPSWMARLPWLAGVAPAGASGAEPDRMLREFGALLDAMTVERPLVLVIEDLHWSDHATVQLLGYLVRRRGSARWLVVTSFRPTDAALADHPLQPLRLELRAQRQCEELLLDAFTEGQVAEYLRRRFDPDPLLEDEALARALHAHTEGLPLFVDHVVDALVAGGQLARDDAAGAWSLAESAWAGLAVPETVTGLVERQIAQLPGELRALLEAASVLGTEFTHDRLATLLGEPAAAVRARCDALARRGQWLAPAGLVEHDDGTLAHRYAFHHALHQRVFHARCVPAHRLSLHQAAAEALQAEGHAERHAAEMAHHLEQAHDIATGGGARTPALAARARRWRLAAARHARELHALDDALAHYAQVLQREASPAERAEVLRERAELLRLLGRGPAALAEAADALRAAEASGDAAVRRATGAAVAHLRVRCDEVDAGLALARDLLADAALEAALRVPLWLTVAEAERHRGRAAAADEALAQALAAAPAQDHATRAAILAERVAACFQSGALKQGLVLSREALAQYECCGHPAGAARMLIRVGTFAMSLERRDEARAALDEALERMRRLGDVDGQRSAILNLVKLHTDGGDTDAALPLLEQGWHLAPDFESPVAASAFLQGFYYCHYLRGELGRAFDDAERVMQGAASLNSIYWRVGAAALVSDLYLHFRETDRARELIDGALAQLDAHGDPSLRPRLLLRRAWLDSAQGRHDEAIARLDALLAAGPLESLEDAANVDRVRAQARLGLDEAEAALAVLAPYDGAPTVEVWAQMLALRLLAHARLGSPGDDDVARARAAIDDRRLPALEGLLVHAALAALFERRGPAAQARAEAARRDVVAARLAASLQGSPQRQAALRRLLDVAA